MKNCIKITIGVTWFLLIILQPPLTCNGADQLLVELYCESIFNPETFNDVVMKKRDHFDEAFYACLNDLRIKLYASSKQRLEICEKYHTDQDLYSKCIGETEAAKFYLWLVDVEAVIRRNIAWENTDTGRIAVMAKQTMQTLYGPEFRETWLGIKKLALPAVESYLVCSPLPPPPKEIKILPAQ